MREKLHPALEELVSWGHLASWVVVKGQSRSYKVVLYQVSTTQQEKQGRGELKQRKEQPSHTSMDTVRPKDPVVKEQPHISSAGAEIARGGISPELLERLATHGFSKDDAQSLWAQKSSPEEFENQLEFAEAEIERQGIGDNPGQIRRPCGFIEDRLKGDRPVPEHFVSSRKRQENEKESQRQLQAATAHDQAYQDYLDQEVNDHIAAEYTKEEYHALIKAKKRAFSEFRPNTEEAALQAWAESSVREDIFKKISSELTPKFQFLQELHENQRNLQGDHVPPEATR